jgi:hypothetical protein
MMSDYGGHFNVVEVCIENRFPVELLPPGFGSRCLDCANQVVASHQTL